MLYNSNTLDARLIYQLFSVNTVEISHFWANTHGQMKKIEYNLKHVWLVTHKIIGKMQVLFAN